MNTPNDLAFQNEVARNGGLITDEIRAKYNIAKPKEGAAEPDTLAEPVAIPEDFANRPWKELQKLVKELTGTGPTDKASAIDTLQAEVIRRAAADTEEGDGGGA